VGVKLVDVVLEAFDPMLLLGVVCSSFFFAIVDEFCDFISQPFIFHKGGIREG